MESELKNKTLIIALNTMGAILIAMAVIALVMHITGIMAQASFIDNLWWAKCAAIAGLALWETGTIVRKMDQQQLSHRKGIIAIVLVSLAVLTAASYFITGVGKWIFYISFALFIVASSIGEGGQGRSLGYPVIKLQSLKHYPNYETFIHHLTIEHHSADPGHSSHRLL